MPDRMGHCRPGLKQVHERFRNARWRRMTDKVSQGAVSQSKTREDNAGDREAQTERHRHREWVDRGHECQIEWAMVAPV